jgi:hypothetical protein
MRYVRISLFVGLIVALSLTSAQMKRVIHDQHIDCLKGCKLCETTIRKGIKYLLRIKDKKRLIWDSREVHWPQTYQKHSTDLYFTSVAALVFMLAGSTHKKGTTRLRYPLHLNILRKRYQSSGYQRDEG